MTLIFWRSDKMIGVYRRRSSEMQKGNASFEVQAEQCERYIKDHFPPDCKILYYDDDAESGQLADRPAINRMIEDSQTGVLSDIVYLTADRMGRDRLVLATLFNRFETAGCRCHSVLGVNPKDEDDFIGQAMRDIEGTFAILESKRRTFGMITGRRKKNQMGIYANGGKLCWGYYQDKKKDPHDNTPRPIKTDQDIKKILHEIWHMIVVDGLGFEAIANILKERDIKSQFGKDWWPQTLCHYFSEENRNALCGHIITGRYKYKLGKTKSGKNYSKIIGEHPPEMWGHHYIKEPLFTDEQYDTLRQAIKKRLRRSSAPTKEGGEHFLLRGLDLRCGVCGERLRLSYGTKNKQGVRPHYYCPDWTVAGKVDRERRGLRKCEHIKRLPADQVDFYFWHQFINSVVFEQRAIDALLSISSKKKKEDNLKKQIEQEESKLKQVKRRVAKLIDEFLEDVDRPTLEVKKQTLRKEQEETERKINKLKNEMDKLKTSLTVAEKFQTKRERLLGHMIDAQEKLKTMPFDRKRDILRHIYYGVTFKFLPVSLEEAKKYWYTPTPKEWIEKGNIHNSDRYEAYVSRPFWFTRGSSKGAFLAWDGYIDETSLLKLLECLENLGQYNYIVTNKEYSRNG